eukprot:1188972-Prorocentrum_minimum.AAC.2
MSTLRLRTETAVNAAIRLRARILLEGTVHCKARRARHVENGAGYRTTRYLFLWLFLVVRHKICSYIFPPW